MTVCWLTRGNRHTRSETKEGQQRPINRTYYFIDYRATIDAIKWRVYTIDKGVQGNTIPKEERKEYKCNRCKSEWTQLEVLDKVDFKHGFLCHKCNFPLVPNEEGDQGGHEQSTRLNAQFRFITDMLPKIDQVVIPDNTFEVAYARAKPVQRDALLNPANETVPVNEGLDRPTAVKGLTNTGPTSIAIELTTGEGPTEEDKAEAAAKRSAYLAQNALPEHFTHSTITGEQIVPASAPAASSMFPLKEDKDDKKIVTTPSFGGEGAAIDDYFAQLKAEQAREAEQEAEEEFETDDEEDQFEDVVPSANGAGSAVATPISALKSAEGSRRSSPGGGTGAESEESGPPNKKVRIEEKMAPEEAKKTEEADSEEDEEFEDV